jgi:hypothetical protein
MKTLNFTQEQITKILSEVASSDNGFNQVLQISLEAMMRAEREEHNSSNSDVSNGFRSVRSFGHGKQLRLSVPRSRNSSFYPILLGVLRNQEEESKRIAFISIIFSVFPSWPSCPPTLRSVCSRRLLVFSGRFSSLEGGIELFLLFFGFSYFDSF